VPLKGDVMMVKESMYSNFSFEKYKYWKHYSKNIPN
jgi:hypothetical protein